MVPSSTAMMVAMARVKNARRRWGLGRPSGTSAPRRAIVGSGRFKAIRRPDRCGGPPSRRGPPQIVGAGAVDLHRHDVARPQGPARCDMHEPVDLRRVALGAALGLK